MDRIVTAFFVLALAMPAIEPAMASPSRFYTVQFSSQLNRTKAKALIAALKRSGVDAFEAKAVVGGRRRYRVCAGYFENPKLAKDARVHFARLVHRKDLFVQSLKGSQIPDSMLFPNREGRDSEWQ